LIVDVEETMIVQVFLNLVAFPNGGDATECQTVLMAVTKKTAFVQMDFFSAAASCVKKEILEANVYIDFSA